MTEIYLIRHAEAEGNLYRIAQGQFNSYITAKGRLQIDVLAERFKDIKLDALYSSDLRRTVETAGAILKYHDLPLQTMKELREINLGVCEGMSFGEMAEYNPQQMRYFNNDPKRWRAPGAESVEECVNRVMTAITDIAEANDGKTVAVVSHGMAIRSLIAEITGVKSSEIEKLPHGDNTSVCLLRYESGKFELEYFNDNSHLPPEISTLATQSWWRKETGGKDDANLSYRPLNPHTEGEIYGRFYTDAWAAAHGNLKGFSEKAYVAAARNRYDENPCSILGVYRSGELIGVLDLDMRRGKAEGYGWISLVYLKPEYRNMGLGVQPLGYAITIFERDGRKSVRLHASAENEHALGFYEHYGFKIIATEPGVGAPLYLMEKVFQ